MTGFGNCYIVKNQNKLEESIISSMMPNQIPFCKITSIEAYDQVNA